MYKSSISVRLPNSMLETINYLCTTKGIDRSKLFREIMEWAVNLPIIVPEQDSHYNFKKASIGPDNQSSKKSVNFHFGGKITCNFKKRIKTLCEKYCTDESHFFRFALDQFIIVNKVPGKVKYLACQGSQASITPKNQFSKPNSSASTKSAKLHLFFKNIQESTTKTPYDTDILSNFLGGLILIFGGKK